MNGKLWGWDDTIIALATPPGIGAIGVLRLSGKEAINITNALFPSKDLTEQASHTLHVGYLKYDGAMLDEVVVSLYKAPRSYTGENVVEISCHGSPYIHQRVIEACIKHGARLAKPGEFTQRAFLAGKLDLTQAEAVADLIASNTAAAHQTALHTVRGGFASDLKELREQLIQFSALLELELDFAQEDVEFADRSALKKLLQAATIRTKQLLDSFKLGNVIKNGVSVAIIGKPNAGKSTLLNALLREDRAIVSDIPGTTRDTIEELINIDGILFRLIDTAGIRQHSTDTIENAGIEKSLQKMRQADVVIYLFDVAQTGEEDLKQTLYELKSEGIHFIPVGNKIDEGDEAANRKKFESIEGVIFIAARKAQHLEILKQRMLDTVLHQTISTENTIITNARHYHALAEVYKAIGEVSNGLESNLPTDLITLDIRTCLHYLGQITGEVSNEDQLDYIFSKFCIGK